MPYDNDHLCGTCNMRRGEHSALIRNGRGLRCRSARTAGGYHYHDTNCFVPSGKYAKHLERLFGNEVQVGDIIVTHGPLREPNKYYHYTGHVVNVIDWDGFHTKHYGLICSASNYPYFYWSVMRPYPVVTFANPVLANAFQEYVKRNLG